ncbi:hypothetical protein EJ357_47670 [Streptomyces cyaneochromogenes]|uniref:Uncharacterized protein n=1 Tax=Streptomyces cyaneochromogenes TaxID=2496836 RepID=A0A3Q9F0S7_9ACTN|nr:hypothetical protein EJ357_00260 [Streptomyces cyaneochromogenes]AZQ40973.1 hypothetical protein EJ357_47670 [Streptomyces cyaneochromogenes]
MEEITANHVHQFLPSPDVVRAVTRWFTSRGFDVGETVGISFPLTGPHSLFQDTFHLPAGELPQEALSLDALPPDIARHIDTATFTPPPEFGPGNP